VLLASRPTGAHAFWFDDSLLQQLSAGLGQMADAFEIFVIPLTPHYDRTAALGFAPVKTEDFTDHPLPAPVKQVRQRLIFVPFAVVVVTVQQVAIDITPATCLAAHALFEPFESRLVDGPITEDLSRLLGASIILITFILIHFENFFLRGIAHF
jgi:hypothetical protein